MLSMPAWPSMAGPGSLWQGRLHERAALVVRQPAQQPCTSSLCCNRPKPHTLAAYLHCVFALRICTAYLHCVFALRICTAYLHCVFALRICTAYLHCVWREMLSKSLEERSVEDVIVAGGLDGRLTRPAPCYPCACPPPATPVHVRPLLPLCTSAPC